MRSILVRFSEIDLSASDIQNLLSVCNKPDVPTGVKINVIQIMGILGKRTNDLNFIQTISVMLLVGAHEDVDVILKAEILDALIDIFSIDDKTDEIAIKLALIPKLKELSKVFCKEVK